MGDGCLAGSMAFVCLVLISLLSLLVGGRLCGVGNDTLYEHVFLTMTFLLIMAGVVPMVRIIGAPVLLWFRWFLIFYID